MKKSAFLAVLWVAAAMQYAQAQISDPLQNFCNLKKSAFLSTGIRMKYIDTGNPEGIPLIFLHGYSDTSRSFKLMIIELMKINKDFRIIAPDLRGHGDSSMPPAAECSSHPERCFTQAGFAEDIISLIDELGLDRVCLIGHSVGSATAQALALKYPDRIQTMVLIGTFVNARENSAIQDLLSGELIEKSWRQHFEEKPGFNWPDDAYFLTPDDMGAETTEFLRQYWVAEACALERKSR